MGFLDKFKKSDDKDKSLKTVPKKHATSRRSTLSTLIKRTLGTGDMRAAVKLPDGENVDEWLCANTVDFYNEVSMLYSMCVEDAMRFTKPSDGGFPPGFEYRWKSDADSKPLRVSSPEYVDYAMTWIESNIDDASVFPTLETEDFPENFKDLYVKDIFKYLFRVLAIMYHTHFSTVITANDATSHLNTVFKHFMFFAFEFDLLDPKEFRALEKPCKRLKADFEAPPSKKK